MCALQETSLYSGHGKGIGSPEGTCVSVFAAMLNERIKAAEMPAAEDEKEVEELKELLPEIKEKIEDAKESQSSGNVAELALKATLVSSWRAEPGPPVGPLCPQA